jgi:hypothetical protein
MKSKNSKVKSQKSKVKKKPGVRILNVGGRRNQKSEYRIQSPNNYTLRPKPHDSRLTSHELFSLLTIQPLITSLACYTRRTPNSKPQTPNAITRLPGYPLHRLLQLPFGTTQTHPDIPIPCIPKNSTRGNKYIRFIQHFIAEFKT